MKKIIAVLIIAVTLLLLTVNTFADSNEISVTDISSNKYITTASSLNFRKKPTTASSIINKIPLGTVVTITETYGDWGKITYNDAEGWISMQYVVPHDYTEIDTSEYAVEWKVIDVSKWQSTINWDKIADSDVKGVIIRIGFRGTATKQIHVDDKFFEYYEGASNAGLHVGCYFYSAATTIAEAQEEALFIIDTIKEHDLKFDMPVYIDMEDDVVLNTGGTQIFKMTNAFLSAMDQENIYSGVYCNSWWAKSFYSDSLFTKHALWIAEWNDRCSYEGNYGMWQYTEKGKINGIGSTYTDLNICYVNYPQLIADNEYNSDEEIIIPPESTEFEEIIIPPESTEFEEITSEQNSSATDIFPNIQKGDVNIDGDITASDARLVLRASSELEHLTSVQEFLADMNSDSLTTASDARKILRISARLE